MDGVIPTSPIIRSNWKPIASLIVPVTSTISNSSYASFTSDNTVSPLTGLRESATVTDVSWTTAFQTPTKPNASKMECENVIDAVLPVQHVESIADLSESDVSLNINESKETNPVTPMPSKSSIACTTSRQSASEVLSTFRNNKRFSYPKAPLFNNQTDAKNVAFFSTPRADRSFIDMPEPPTSAIASSCQQLPPMRLRMCPCGTCSCPAVYLKDVGVQTIAVSNEFSPLEKEDVLAASGFTQTVAQQIGQYDGFTQQSIIRETAKASRKRPKPMVKFNEPSEDKNMVLNGSIHTDHLFESLTSKKGEETTFREIEGTSFKNYIPSFKKAGTGATITVNRRKFDAKKLFGQDFDDIQSSTVNSENVSHEAAENVTKGANTGTMASFKKAGSGVSIAINRKLDDMKKLFGADYDAVQLSKNTNMPTKSLVKLASPEKRSASPGAPAFSSFKKGSGSPISVNRKAFNAHKLFGEDFADFKATDNYGGHLTSGKSASDKRNSTFSDANRVLGDDLFPNILNARKELPGFKSAKQSNALSPVSESNNCINSGADVSINKIVGNDLKATVQPDEQSDVESVYDDDLDSRENSIMSIPDDFFLSSDQILASPAVEKDKTAEFRAQQRHIIAEKASLSSRSGSHGIIWRTRTFASEQSLLSLAKCTPNYGNGDLDLRILRLIFNPTNSFRFPPEVENCAVVVHWQTVDGGLLVSAPDGTVGIDELKTCLYTTPGIDPRLIPDNWIENHYRLILWKLARQVFCFRQEFRNPWARLNPECIMQQLKYRYDREIDLCQRSCIRRIVEKDSSSKQLMILSVVKIVHQTSSSTDQLAITPEDDQHSRESTTSSHGSQVRLELTDGWYSVSAQIDAVLQRMVNTGRIFVGCKLVISGAELNGLEEGVDPLHIPSACHLRLCANSTRLVTKWWSAKLGFLCKPNKLCVPIRSLFAGGGNANAIKIVVSRIYPMLYVEKRTSSGGTTDCIYRLEADELAEADKVKAAQERKVEDLMNKMAADSQSPGNSPKPGGKRRKISANEVKELSTGEEIAAALRDSLDPESVDLLLSDTQRTALQNYMASRSDRMAKRIRTALEQTRDEASKAGGGIVLRNVTPVLKVFVIGWGIHDRQRHTTATISIWRPPENARDLLQEGRLYFFHNVSVSKPQSSFGHAILNGTQHTSWQPVTAKTDNVFIERTFLPLRDFASSMSNARLTSYTNRETDILGIILRSVVDGTNRKLYFADTDGEVGLIQGTAIGFNGFISNEYARLSAVGPVLFVATNLRISMATTSFNQQLPTNFPVAMAQDYSTFYCLPPNMTTIPSKLLNSCRHAESAIKDAITVRAEIAEKGLAKLESLLRMYPQLEEPRSLSRSDFRNSSLLTSSVLLETAGPQRPGSSTKKTTPLVGPELQKRKMDKLDRLCANSSISIPSPLPSESGSTRSRSVLRRAFRPPLMTNSADKKTKPN